MINCNEVSLGDEVIWRLVPDISFWFWLFAGMPSHDLPFWPGFSQNVVTKFHSQTPERESSQQESNCHFMTRPQKLCSITCFVRQSVRPFEVQRLFLGEWWSSGKGYEIRNIALMNFKKYQLLHEESEILLYYGGSINWQFWRKIWRNNGMRYTKSWSPSNPCLGYILPKTLYPISLKVAQGCLMSPCLRQ